MNASNILIYLTYNIFDQIDLLKLLLDKEVTDSQHRRNYERFLDNADNELNKMIEILKHSEARER